MKTMLYVIACLSGIAAFMITANSKGAIHEIYGAVLFLVSMVTLSGAAIVSVLESHAEATLQQLRSITESAQKIASREI